MNRIQPKTHSFASAWTIALAIGLALTGTYAGATAPSFPASVTVEGKQVHRIGSGLREFLWLDIYVMGAYSSSGSCNPRSMVSTDESRYLRLYMEREIPKSRMVSNLKGSLEDNLPANASAQLKAKVQTFVGYIKSDFKEGSMVEIYYVPGKGTGLKKDGRRLGPNIPGKDFADTVWRAYFGRNTCCSGLKRQIIESCRAAR